MRGLLFSSASLLVTVFGAGAVSAQQAPAQEAGAAPAYKIEEIIVTAQKREQRLQDVPVSVTVVGAAQLDRQGIKSAAELQYAVPVLSYNAGPSTSYAVRGVGTNTFARSAENAVSVVVDGVVQGQYVPPASGLFDLQRVEVLSGPQGMLFGRNASAGVINIVTTAPKIGVREFTGRVELGERGYQTYRGVANLPLGETAALRVSAFSDSQDGILRNLYQGGHDVGDFTNAGVRAKLRWEAKPDVAVTISADYERDHGGNFLWTARTSSAPFTAALAACGVTPGPTNTNLCVDGQIQKVIESYGVSAQVDWSIGDYTLTSITADRQFSRFANNDSDTVPVNLLNLNVATDFSNQFTQELRIASPTGRKVEYVAGVFFYNYSYKAFVDQAGKLGFLATPADRTSLDIVNQISYALFGQATIHLTDKVALIAGGRETYDLLRTSNTGGINPASGVFIPGFSNKIGKNPSVRVGEANFSYRVGLQYKPDDASLLYLTYARGYKGPAANAGERTTAPVIIRPEIPTNIELGYKTAFLDRRMLLDATLYHQDVKDFQAQLVQTVNGFTSYVFGNASHLYAKGLEVNVSARPTRGLRIDGGLNYNDATYGHFLVPCRASTATVACDVKGRQLSGAPKWKFVLSGEYSRGVTNDLEGYGQVGVNYRTRMNASSTPDPMLEIKGYALVDGRIGVRAKDGRWGASVFAKNLFDKRFPAALFADPLLSSNYDQAFSPSSFRMIGVALDGRF